MARKRGLVGSGQGRGGVCQGGEHEVERRGLDGVRAKLPEHSLSGGSLQLWEQDGSSVSLLERSLNEGTAGEKLERVLDAGTYCARVFHAGGTQADYDLTIQTGGAGNDDTPPAARDTGVLAGKHMTNDHLGTADAEDWYKFTFDALARVHVRLGGLTDNADIYLVAPNGVTLASSTNTGTAIDYLTRILPAGTWYVCVDAAPGIADADYLLALRN
jgi:hypothetical protein